jgi:hypothetical protein
VAEDVDVIAKRKSFIQADRFAAGPDLARDSRNVRSSDRRGAGVFRKPAQSMSAGGAFRSCEHARRREADIGGAVQSIRTRHRQTTRVKDRFRASRMSQNDPSATFESSSRTPKSRLPLLLVNVHGATARTGRFVTLRGKACQRFELLSEP